MNSMESVPDIVRRIEGESDDLPARLRRVARLALPPDARIAVVTLGDARLLDLDVPHELPFPAGDGLADEADDEALIAELERIRSERIHFLAVPDPARSWLARHDRLERHLETRYRRVLDEEQTGLVFALQEPGDLPPDGMGRDGLPVPPPEMIRLVAGMLERESIYEPFLASGELGAASVRATLERNGLEIDGFESILDFGCGCGRVLRQWRSLDGPRLHGSDYNPLLVEWCRTNLPFAEFATNGIAPPLSFDDGQFDFVYALSVFTHLVEALQVPWALEIARVLRPGGHALFTLHGRGRVHELDSPDARARFEAGKLVVLRPERAGTNTTAVFHPERYVRDVLASEAGFEVVDHVPDGQRDSDQDAILLQRR